MSDRGKELQQDIKYYYNYNDVALQREIKGKNPGKVIIQYYIN